MEDLGLPRFSACLKVFRGLCSNDRNLQNPVTRKNLSFARHSAGRGAPVSRMRARFAAGSAPGVARSCSGPRPGRRAGARPPRAYDGHSVGRSERPTLTRMDGVDTTTFYDESRIAIIPMGYCYPGRGKDGDMAPRRECAQLWLHRLLAKLPEIELTLLVGQYAQRHFLGSRRKRSLAETTRNWQDYSPQYIPLPHPSPRNQPWFKQHPWFEQQLVPALQMRISPLVTR